MISPSKEFEFEFEVIANRTKLILVKIEENLLLLKRLLEKSVDSCDKKLVKRTEISLVRLEQEF